MSGIPALWSTGRVSGDHCGLMRIALFGGTGLAGAPLLDHALAAGHTVTLLARHPEAVSPREGLTVIGGNALEGDDVAKTVAGSNAVLSTLGGFGDSDACLHGTTHIIEAMRSTGVRRLVLLQGFHLQLPGDPATLARRVVGTYLRLSDRELPRNTQAMADELRTVDDLDWTLVRVPRLVHRPATGQVTTGSCGFRPWNKAFTGVPPPCSASLRMRRRIGLRR